jgi:pimeloyl-ACP methyl ester carboxylesterase
MNRTKMEPLIRRFRVVAFASALALVGTACGGTTEEGGPEGAGIPNAQPTTESQVEESPEIDEGSAPEPRKSATTEAAGDETPAFTETTNIVYRTVDGVELLMDVFTPAGEGPWPMVVSFHGLSGVGKDDGGTVPVAEAAATDGMVVFTPTWIAGDPFPITRATFDGWDDTVYCAVAFAQEIATEYGADPTTTVVDGFSAGAGAALLYASQEPRVGSVEGCETGEAPTAVNGFVIGDAEAWLHSPNFDEAFQLETADMQDRLGRLIGPDTWDQATDVGFFIWVSESFGGPRPIDDPNAPGWFTQRDPDGSIEADLERLGYLDDGGVTYVEAGELLGLRLSEAGFEVSVDRYPGGHTTSDKVPEIVGYLKAAATE